MAMTSQQRDLMRLVLRSDDIGEGWRQVSEMLWPMVLELYVEELYELDPDNKRVRFNDVGAAVARYTV